jgi:hypothetical protein
VYPGRGRRASRGGGFRERPSPRPGCRYVTAKPGGAEAAVGTGCRSRNRIRNRSRIRGPTQREPGPVAPFAFGLTRG